MKKELIERLPIIYAIDKMIGIAQQGEEDNELRELTLIPLRHIKELVTALPTVDAEPVKHGKWVRIDEFTIKCSMCNQGGIFASDWEYCPLCGAKMDEVTK